MKDRLMNGVALCVVLLSAGLAARDLDAMQAASAQAAAATLAGAADQQFTAEGVTLRFRELGSGDPVVLIHGYSASLESMAGVANALSTTHRVIALDVRGFGRSSKFADAARFGTLMADDVVRLLDHLRLSRAHLVGHSMGALIAANVAARSAARVATATLVAGPFYADKPTFTKETLRWLDDLESGKGLTNFAQWLFPKMETAMAATVSAQMMKVNDASSLIAVMRSLPDLAISGLGVSGAKALVVVGTGDPLHPLSVAFAEQSPGARLLVIDGADHINVIANDEVMRAMREVLQRVAATSGVLREAA
jgi:pimeloyl-ACP methyl ester carboxylesterase